MPKKTAMPKTTMPQQAASAKSRRVAMPNVPERRSKRLKTDQGNSGAAQPIQEGTSSG